VFDRRSWLRRLPLIYTAEVTQGEAGTRLEWVVDSDYRFFPTVPDETFGYVLHPVDLAMNKVMAAAGRRELRDIVDLVTVHETILPLGAVIWAAVEKSPGFTPEGRMPGSGAANGRAVPKSVRPCSSVTIINQIPKPLQRVNCRTSQSRNDPAAPCIDQELWI
jgi:hypothetical protein